MPPGTLETLNLYVFGLLSRVLSPQLLPVHLRRAICEGPWSGFSDLLRWSEGELFPLAWRFLLPEGK